MAYYHLTFVLAVALMPSVRAADVKVADTVVGDVTVSAAEQGDWKLTASQDTADGVSVVTVRLAAPEAAKPPKFTVSFACPGVGADHVWTPYDDRYWIRPYEWGATPYESQLAFRAPLAAAFRANGENVLSLACSEAFDALKYGLTIGSSDCRLHGELAFFTEYAAPRTSYEAKIRIDTRKVRWSRGVSDAADWVSKTAGLAPCAVPAAARDPMYSTWYAFWQDVKADVLEREAPLAAALGMKAMILDDGWQKEKSRTYYSATGDWMPVKGRFPDMKEHVAKIHAAGLKYILWLSVPFVGDESAAYARFKDKFLCEPDPGSGTYVLDVRFPEVREYLIATYERAVRDWGFDGLKLDFIDLLKIPATGDPAEKDNWKGRDIRALPVAVDTLMKDVRRRLIAINPEVLIEFRQQYMGPAIRQYGNMIRATDCPADSDKIRKLVCDLRLTSGTTAVHSDMLVWHPDETPERAARPILNSLFSTIQYSMVLARLPEAHREVIRHWLAFTQAHRATLLDGAFLPEHPEALYPLVAAESASERIAVAYTIGTVVPALAGGKPAWAINATDAEGLIVDAAADGMAEIFDTFGCSRGKVSFSKGLVRLAVSPSGYAALRANVGAAGVKIYGVHPDPSVIVAREPLWPEGRMPDAQEDQMPVPELQWYAPPAADLRTGTCMILVSGGSYQELSDFFALDEVAAYLTAKGVQCVNLAYRVPRPKNLPKYQSAWEDGQRAVRLVRSEAVKRGYDPEKIGALGTSAGGHAVLMMALNSQSPAYARVDELDDVPCHVNVAVPIFPGHCLHVGDETSWSIENGRTDISLSPVLSFDAKTPPICLMHGGIDWVSPLGSVLVYEELRRRKIPAEIHLIADRNHGFQLGAKEGATAFMWKDRVSEFLLQLGFLGPVPPEVPQEGRRTDAFTHSVSREPLWPEGKMPDVQTNQTAAPYLEWYLPKKVATYSVQMVFPGGAYDKVSDPQEGKYVAERFNAYGMAAVVVHYRTPHPVGLPEYYSAWQDAQRAIRLVRRGARRKGLNPDSIGAIGFSAGGNLVLHCATRSLKPAYARVDEADDLSCSLQWAIPVYPWHVLDGNRDAGGIVKDFAFDLATPPMCFLHGDADWVAPAMGSVKAWTRLREMGVQCDLHTLIGRGHCFQFKAAPGTASDSWFGRIEEFFVQKALLK